MDQSAENGFAFGGLETINEREREEEDSAARLKRRVSTTAKRWRGGKAGTFQWRMECKNGGHRSGISSCVVGVLWVS